MCGLCVFIFIIDTNIGPSSIKKKISKHRKEAKKKTNFICIQILYTGRQSVVMIENRFLVHTYFVYKSILNIFGKEKEPVTPNSHSLFIIVFASTQQ